MKAFIEWIEYKKSGIVRAGPHTSRYGKPYEYALVFVRHKFRPDTVVLKALTADGRMGLRHHTALLRVLKPHFKHLVWERIR